jgi:hypothetical protein
VADLYVGEHKWGYSGQGSMVAQILPQPSLAVQKISISGASTQSSAFNDRTRAIEIVADGACHIAIGDDPTAAATTMLLPANTPRIYGVSPGQKIAVIT